MYGLTTPLQAQLKWRNPNLWGDFQPWIILCREF